MVMAFQSMKYVLGVTKSPFWGRVFNIGIKSETVFGVIFICQKCAAEKRKH